MPPVKILRISWEYIEISEKSQYGIFSETLVNTEHDHCAI